MRARVTSAALILAAVMMIVPGSLAAQGRRSEAAPRDAGRAQASASPIEVRRSISRTAVWVGDKVVYTVALHAAPNVEVLPDDMLKERLQIDGGEIVSAEPERVVRGGHTITRMHYTLVTYRVDAAAITVAPLPVRYYARGGGQRPGDTAPAGEVTVPGLTIAVRSTVPEAVEAIELRPAAGIRPASQYLRAAAPLALGLLAVALVPAALLTLNLARGVRRVRAAYHSRRSRRKQRGSFEEIKSLQPDSDAERVEAFGRLDAFVRDHLSLTTGIAAHSLTPGAASRVLQGRGTGAPHNDVEALLEACERARYSSDAPSSAEWADAVRDAEALLHALRR